MDKDLLDFWAYHYSEAVRKGFLDYDTIEISLVFSNQMKLLNKIRKILGVTDPVFLMKTKYHGKVSRIRWRLEF